MQLERLECGVTVATFGLHRRFARFLKCWVLLSRRLRLFTDYMLV